MESYGPYYSVKYDLQAVSDVLNGVQGDLMCTAKITGTVTGGPFDGAQYDFRNVNVSLMPFT